MDLESAAVPSTASKPITRRTILISATVVLLVIVAVIAALATTVGRTNSSPYPAPVPHAATAFRTLSRRGQLYPSWQLDTTRRPALSTLLGSDMATSLTASRAESSDVHEFQWSFPPRNQQWLVEEVEAVSNPQSPRYGQHSSFETIMAKVGPTADEKAAVVEWLQSNGVGAAVIQDSGDILHVISTVGQVESLFSTTLHYHQNTVSGQTGTVSAGDVSVPSHLAMNQLHGVYNFPHQLMHIGTHRSTVQPYTPPVTPARDAQAESHSFHTTETNRHCSGSFSYYPLASPQFLAGQYNYPLRNTSTGLTHTSATVTAFGGQAFSQADLTHQQGNIGFSQPFNPAVFNAAGNAANLASYGVGDEANLDIQVLYQISPTSNNSFFSTTAHSGGSLLQTLSWVAALPNATRPQVVSISYGFDASDYQYYHSSDGAATETKLQQLAALGVTVIASAGDDGTSGPYNTGCSTAPNSIGYGTISPITTTTFLPTYPASSAYVLSVAETDFLASAVGPNQAFGAFTTGVQWPAECDNCPSDQSAGFLCQASSLGEEVVSSANKNNITGQTSGGGFSAVFAAPSWQKANVTSYLTSRCAASKGCTLPPASYYNAANRGYPDVSAFGGQFGITLNGEEAVFAGTSVAAPLWAGLIARLNEVQLARKGTRLGLVAPLFYTMATASPSTFHDLTTGENTCPQGNSACVSYVQWGGGSTTCKGWHGATGWDPVTGLGSPNIGNIITYLQTH